MAIGMLCALPDCSRGELSKWVWATNEAVHLMLECCRPLAVEVFRITNAGVPEE